MAKEKKDHHIKEKKASNEQRNNSGVPVSSTTSLGKRRRLNESPSNGEDQRHQQQQSAGHLQSVGHHKRRGRQDQHSEQAAQVSTMSNPKSSDYGSQASPLRVPTKPAPQELVKVTIVGAAGGIGQPLAMLLMLHSEYIQHLALYDLVNVHGVGADLAHIDRQCKVTTHLGLDELPEAVRNAKVIVIPAGLAQKPGMSRDDLFGSNSTIMAGIAKVCAQVNPQAMLAIISNPVNSLVPLTCEVYSRVLSQQRAASNSEQQQQQQQQQQQSNRESEQSNLQTAKSTKSVRSQRGSGSGSNFEDCFRRIFGVTTLDVVRASTLTAKSAFFKSEPSGLFKDPANISVPVVGGHAGKTIMPLLSQATPKIDRKRLIEERASTLTLIETIQQAGIEVLNAKRGTGSATLAMAYAACRFTISLLRAQQGEQNIVECAYVKHREAYVDDLEYFSCPLQLGKDGYVKALPLGKLLPFEERMVEEGCKELRTSVAKGEDFAKEHLN